MTISIHFTDMTKKISVYQILVKISAALRILCNIYMTLLLPWRVVFVLYCFFCIIYIIKFIIFVYNNCTVLFTKCKISCGMEWSVWCFLRYLNVFQLYVANTSLSYLKIDTFMYNCIQSVRYFNRLQLSKRPSVSSSLQWYSNAQHVQQDTCEK